MTYVFPCNVMINDRFVKKKYRKFLCFRTFNPKKILIPSFYMEFSFATQCVVFFFFLTKTKWIDASPIWCGPTQNSTQSNLTGQAYRPSRSHSSLILCFIRDDDDAVANYGNDDDDDDGDDSIANVLQVHFMLSQQFNFMFSSITTKTITMATTPKITTGHTATGPTRTTTTTTIKVLTRKTCKWNA